MSRIVLLALLSSFLLTGCNAAGVQPDISQPVEPQVTPPPVSVDQSAEFEKLNSRITLLQEQFLELKVQNSSVAERVQLLLTQFQVLAQQVKRSAVEKNGNTQPDLRSVLLGSLVGAIFAVARMGNDGCSMVVAITSKLARPVRPIEPG